MGFSVKHFTNLVFVLVAMTLSICIYFFLMDFGNVQFAFNAKSSLADAQFSSKVRGLRYQLVARSPDDNQTEFLSPNMSESYRRISTTITPPIIRTENLKAASRFNETEFLALYERFNGGRKFFNECSTCALVSSSGTMLNSSAGKEIDQNRCVIRMNNAPTLGFEQDVGSKTTYRVLSHTSVSDVADLLKDTAGAEATHVGFLVWGPKRNIGPGGPVNTMMHSTAKTYPKIQMYAFKPSTMQWADQIFEDETGRNRMNSGSYLTTGWFTMLFIKNLCQQIHVYGMVEDTHCEKVKKKVFPEVQYHYYQSGATQCAVYNGHENARAGAHRYLTEKRVFKRWAEEWGNLDFRHPSWDLNTEK